MNASNEPSRIPLVLGYLGGATVCPGCMAIAIVAMQIRVWWLAISMAAVAFAVGRVSAKAMLEWFDES